MDGENEKKIQVEIIQLKDTLSELSGTLITIKNNNTRTQSVSYNIGSEYAHKGQ